MKVILFLLLLTIQLAVVSSRKRFRIQSIYDDTFWAAEGDKIVLRKNNPLLWYAQNVGAGYQLMPINNNRILTYNGPNNFITLAGYGNNIQTNQLFKFKPGFFNNTKLSIGVVSEPGQFASIRNEGEKSYIISSADRYKQWKLIFV
ncbi:hypothetical protein RclHR1_09360001 [Rhizophagus clarus]|uniref:Ricin B lectin domain-containing protein n=1 Tax=Rhizophagus clarus TaxID=94130 RepID=A0A2Z6SA75_9GLOM|nr:hypothetical protein RclHR1_09360001 [Rhizophagus clarus]GES82864.1 hypothetical protein RCL_jg15866.t1 [Rhizophagus clarus]